MIDVHAHVTMDVTAQLARARSVGVDTTILLATRVHPEAAGTVAELRAQLAGLGRVIAGAGDTEQAAAAAHTELRAALDAHPDTVGMWKVPLDADDDRIAAQVLAAAGDSRIVGIGELTPPPGHAGRIESVLRACADLASTRSLPVLVHGFAPNTAADLDEYARLAAAYPTVPVIIGAFGGLNSLQAVELACTRRNLHLDLSSALQVFVVAAALRQIPEQCLFGSNTPYGDVAANLHVLEAATHDPYVRDLASSGNAARIFEIPTLR